MPPAGAVTHDLRLGGRTDWKNHTGGTGRELRTEPRYEIVVCRFSIAVAANRVGLPGFVVGDEGQIRLDDQRDTSTRSAARSR